MLSNGSYMVGQTPGAYPCAHGKMLTQVRRIAYDGQMTLDLSCVCGHTEVRLTYKQKRNR